MLVPLFSYFVGFVQFEFLAITKLETTKLVNNPMAGLVNTGENFWMGKVTPLAQYMCGPEFSPLANEEQ